MFMIAIIAPEAFYIEEHHLKKIMLELPNKEIILSYKS